MLRQSGGNATDAATMARGAERNQTLIIIKFFAAEGLKRGGGGTHGETAQRPTGEEQGRYRMEQRLREVSAKRWRNLPA